MAKSLIRKNQLHPDVSDLVSGYGTGFFVTFDQLNNAIDTSQQIITLGAVLVSGNQAISGLKNFATRPTVNGTGVLLQGEAIGESLSNVVFTTGNQIISGEKIFKDFIIFSGDNIVTSGNNQQLFLYNNAIGFIKDFPLQEGYPYFVLSADSSSPSIILENMSGLYGQGLYPEIQFRDARLDSKIDPDFIITKLNNNLTLFTGDIYLNFNKRIIFDPYLGQIATPDFVNLRLKSNLYSIDAGKLKSDTIEFKASDATGIFKELSANTTRVDSINFTRNFIPTGFPYNYSTSGTTTILNPGQYFGLTRIYTGWNNAIINPSDDNQSIKLSSGSYVRITVSGMGNLDVQVVWFAIKNIVDSNPINFDLLNNGVASNYIRLGGLSVYNFSGFLPKEYDRIAIGCMPGNFGALPLISVSGDFGINNEIRLESRNNRLFLGTSGTLFQGEAIDLSTNQTISGVKNFVSRPTVNGTGVLLSGEAAQVDLSSTVRITGNQTISGVKSFSGVIYAPELYVKMPSIPKTPTFVVLTGAGGVPTGTRHWIPFNNSVQDQEALSNFINSQYWRISGRNGFSGPYTNSTGDFINTTGFIDTPLSFGNGFVYEFVDFSLDNKLKKIERSGVFALLTGERIGIGTFTPTEKLDVSGTIKSNAIILNTRPFVNGTGALLSGEAIDLSTNQTISGTKTFIANSILYSGVNVNFDNNTNVRFSGQVSFTNDRAWTTGISTGSNSYTIPYVRGAFSSTPIVLVTLDVTGSTVFNYNIKNRTTSQFTLLFPSNLTENVTLNIRATV